LRRKAALALAEIERRISEEDPLTMATTEEWSRMSEFNAGLDRRYPVRRSIVPPAILTVCLIVATALAVRPIPRTHIRLQATVRGIELAVPNEAIVFPRIQARDVVVTGYDTMSAPPDVRLREDLGGEVASVRSGAGRLDGVDQSFLGLDGIALSRGSTLEIFNENSGVWHTEVKGGGRVSLVAPEFLVGDIIRGKKPSMRPIRLDFAGSATSGRRLVTQILQQGDGAWPFASDVAVNRLALWARERTSVGDLSLDRPLSTVIKGSVVFSALNGQTRQILPFEYIALGKPVGIVHSLIPSGAGLELVFSGYVDDISVNENGSDRSIMPSVLQVLVAYQPMIAVWGAVGFLLGLSGTLKQWWLGR
jgi:hypothetical protein